MNSKEVLKVYFGYDSYKPGQEELINSILSGRDVLAVMPTGSGKSICYQVPAMLLPGITIVISPLISLMQDQVKALNEVGIHAGYINSSLSETQIKKVYLKTIEGDFKILYVAPERLESWEFSDFARHINISMVTVDEAHCISQWGQDFRPSYLKIVDFIAGLSRRPIVSAFTATATEEVRLDISCVLRLQNPNIVITGFDRDNLYFDVEVKTKKDDYVLNYVQEHLDDSGIIYCATRKNVDTLYELLKSAGISVARYHAGMDNEDRKENQNDFIFDRTPVIVATNAFGMGIDKSNVRYVIHYNMPQSMENYYQEAGRAGRDGETAQCILLFSAQDIIINRFLLDHKEFIDVNEEDIPLIKQRDVKRLQIIEGYCRTSDCFRNYILEYFGEKRNKPCDNCGNCHRDFDELDMTAEAKQVINCVYETKGKYGQNIVLGTLLGANRARLRELGATDYKTYGALKECSETVLRLLINQMIQDGYLYQTVDKYSVLRLGNIDPLKDEKTRVLIKSNKDREPERKISRAMKRSTDSLTKAGYELFELLRTLRLTVAREEGMPPYIIFSDKALIDMCAKMPKNRAEMLRVSGVGEAKYEKYGERFIDEIKSFIDDNPGVVTSIDENTAIASGRSKTRREKKGKKGEFYLNPEDVQNFAYEDYYYISDICDELNRISTVENVKRCSRKRIWEYLVSKGYVEERSIDGVWVKIQTGEGIKRGIVTIERVSSKGNEYSLLRYPREIQKEVAEFFADWDVANSVDDDYEEDAHTSEFNRAEYNRKMNRPEGAGASWSLEEDNRLEHEYREGKKIAEIALLHDRTQGAIRSRLKKQGLVE